MKGIILFVTALLLLAGCEVKKQAPPDAESYYTCSMHPHVHAAAPGKCPICQMTLIAVNKTKPSNPDEVQLTNAQMQLANIKVDTIKSSATSNQAVLPGTVTFNQKNVTAISARVTGRIDRLYYKNTGDYVSRGSRLFELYSEELNSAKQEYVLLLNNSTPLTNTLVNYSQLLQSGRTKLLLWGMLPAQISALEKTHKAPPTTTFYSNAGGYITNLDVSEGSYVTGGQTILRLANTASVWIEAQAYATQLPQINGAGKVTVQVPAAGNQQITGTIDFVNPEMDPRTRINLVRINVPNHRNQLKPGMAAYVFFSGKQQQSISLPAAAVIRNSTTAHVWVQTGANTFTGKMVTTGTENNNRIEILQGLKQGDRVVTSGTYLLNSEYLLKSGDNAMQGMKM